MMRVDYVGEDGTLHNLPKAWTSAAAEDPFVRMAAGRSAFRVSDLLALAALLDGMDEDDGAEKGTVCSASGVKEILPHM